MNTDWLILDDSYTTFGCFSSSVTDHLGSGQFGTVNKGEWGTMEVAVKTLKTDAKEEDKVKFLQEAAIMGQFNHPNVVKLHGVITMGEPVSDSSWTPVGWLCLWV